MLHNIEEDDGEDDEGHQFYDLGPASLAPLAQANGEDDHRNGDNEQEQRGHSLESTSTPLGALERLIALMRLRFLGLPVARE
jgi:hypothetical protein